MNWLSLLGLEAFVARWRANVIEGAIAAEDRLELARLEWLDQKQRLQQLLVLLIAVTGLTVVTLVLVSIAILVQFWDTSQRALAAWLLAGLWLVASGAVLAVLLSMARKTRSAFALTRRELAQDWRVIKEQL